MPESTLMTLTSRVELNEQQRKIFLDRYAARDLDAQPIEHAVEDAWWRVADAIAEVETDGHYRWAQTFYNAMEGFRFVPGGRIISAAGTGRQVTFSNCFALPYPEDSCDGIVESLRQMIQIMRRGGGVGINISSIRPRGAYIKTVNGRASGPVNWSELFSVATGTVISQGGSRRGALLLLLACDHPDIEEFIVHKRLHPGSLEAANLSVGVTDAFMAAVKADASWDLHWGGTVYKTMPARELWHLICESAWAYGDPGLVFLERMQTESNTRYFEQVVTCNPCGEQPLSPWAVCNLGSINLSTMVTPEGGVDWTTLRETVWAAVRFLDNVIEVNHSFTPEMEDAQKRSRRIGVGTMGLAHYLFKRHIRYGSPQCLHELDSLYRFIRDQAYMASVSLSIERGPFPRFDREEYLDAPFVRRLPPNIQQMIFQHGIRNAVVLTQAPTGTISILAGTSSGIEPVFDLEYKRTDRTGEHVMRDPIYQGWLERAAPGEPAPDYFVGALDITPEEHVRVQAKIQEYTDASISKTANGPSSHTVEDVERLYELAYDLGCKGLTYFRNGSRDAVLTTTREEKPAAKTNGNGNGHSNGASALELPKLVAGLCPVCGKPVVHTEGCERCGDPDCGWAACKL